MSRLLVVFVAVSAFEAIHGSSHFTCPAGQVLQELSVPSSYYQYAASMSCKNADKAVIGQPGQMKCLEDQANFFLLDPIPCSNFKLLKLCFRVRNVKEIRATFGGFFEFEKKFFIRQAKIGEDPHAWNKVCLDTLDISSAHNPLGDDIWNMFFNFRRADGADKMAIQNLEIVGCQFEIPECDTYYSEI